jgi:hypothetical protein
MPQIELRNARTFKKGQAVKLGQRLGDIVVLSINLPYPVHLTPFLVFACRP